MKVKALMVVLILACAATAFAVPANWHRLAEIVGVVKPPSSTRIPITVDSGTLQPAQSFDAQGYANLTCNTEYNVSKIVLAIPSSRSEWYAMAGGF